MDFVSSNGKAFAYQGVSGLKFDIIEHFSLFTDLGYTGAKSKMIGNTEYRLGYYSGNIGVTYNI